MITLRDAARVGLLLTLVAGLGAGVAVPAWAAAPATVTRSGSTLVFTAGSATANQVAVTQSGGNFTIHDSGAAINPGPGSGCVNSGADTVVCVATGVAALNISTLDRNDAVELAVTVPATIAGGNGNDSLSGGSGHDLLQGGGGSDDLFGGGGNDNLNGGGGNDSLQGGFGHDHHNGGGGNDTFDKQPGVDAGNDTFNGGSGTDTINYATGVMSSQDVAVSLDDAANDGFFGCCDNVRSSIENVTTGGGDDTLVGSGAANTLRSGGGNDHLDGLGGNDTLVGLTGNDTLLGGAGFDALDGGLGTDICDVGPGGGTRVGCEG